MYAVIGGGCGINFVVFYGLDHSFQCLNLLWYIKKPNLYDLVVILIRTNTFIYELDSSWFWFTVQLSFFDYYITKFHVGFNLFSCITAVMKDDIPIFYFKGIMIFWHALFQFLLNAAHYQTRVDWSAGYCNYWSVIYRFKCVVEGFYLKLYLEGVGFTVNGTLAPCHQNLMARNQDSRFSGYSSRIFGWYIVIWYMLVLGLFLLANFKLFTDWKLSKQ